MTEWREQLEEDGYAILRAALTHAQISTALAEWAEVNTQHANDPAILANDGPPYGARNLLHLWPGVLGFARLAAIAQPVLEVLGSLAGAVRVLFFDKPPGHSWALPWHKDYCIAVAEHGIEGKFTKPTSKAGVPHVIAPVGILDRMLTVRIHLDDVTPQNGALRVVPGSQRHYRMGLSEARGPVPIYCRAGDVLLMRPLLTHASGHSQTAAALHRRILHIECAASPELPDAYRWHSFHTLAND